MLLLLPGWVGCGGSGGSVDASVDARVDAALPPDASCPAADAESCASGLDPLGGTPAPRLPVNLAVAWEYRPAQTFVAGVIVLPGARKVVVREKYLSIVMIDLVDQSVTAFSPTPGLPASGNELSPYLVADSAENFYVVGHEVYAYSPTGAKLWETAMALPVPPGGGGPGIGSLAIRGRTLYLTANSGRVYALDSATGSQKWSVSTPTGVTRMRASGRGDTLFVPAILGGVLALSADSGAVRWQAPCPHHRQPHVPVPMRTGILAGSRDFSGTYTREASDQSYRLSSCGDRSPDLPVDAEPDFALETRTGWLTSSATDQTLAMYELNHFESSTGAVQTRRVIGVNDGVERTFSTYPVAVGADDVVYVLESFSRTNPTRDLCRLHQLTLPDLTPVGPPLELGAGVGRGGAAAMTDDGLLVLSVESGIVAVRTPSPGPLARAWSLGHGDARGSRWLEP